MPEVICSYCDLKYASRRNLKRHINAVHNSNVRYVGCNEPNCDRIFFRREYLLIHLQSTHKRTVEEARGMSRDAYLGYTPRENIETCGPQEKKIKIAEEENVPGPSNPEVPEVKEFVDEVILQEDASEFDIESAQEGAGHSGSASGGTSLEPDDIYISDSNSSTTASNSDEEGESHIDSVEIVNLSLITIRSTKNGVSSVRREHNFATSTHYDPRSFDWRGFIRHMEEELCDHAEALRKTEVAVEPID
ncbi:unnamed protein product [Mytilus edulis]|uniref:C2H2-type domain-containing protein n=1 Tax=Mytilus edulis TaxID=6550 RepID=A0A8S3S808_MYTED|nr:unnamed protein product [Mytilus edulis]